MRGVESCKFIAAASAVLFACIAPTHAVYDDAAPLHVSHVEMSAALDDQLPRSDAQWQPIDLPHRWGPGVEPDGRTVWYRLILKLAHPGRVELAVYLPKVSMNADLWIAGRLAARIGRMTNPMTRHWNTPLLFRIPPVVLAAGSNELLIRVRALDRHDGGLAPFWVGPAANLEPVAENMRFWRITLVNMLVACVLVLAFVVFLVWARRPDRLDYLYFSLGAIGCGISSLNMTVTTPPISDEAWEVLIHISLHGGVLCLALFGWEFAGVPTQRRRWVMLAIALLDLVALVVLDGTAHRIAVAIFSLIVFATAALALLPMVRALRRRPLTDFVIFGFAAIIATSVGAYDWLVVSGMLPYEAPFALPYVWPIPIGAFAWLIAGDYARSQRELATLNAELADRVRAREAALRATHEQLRTAERAQSMAEERARILRDMHDGVGAHLATALRQLEHGDSSRDEVVRTLRDSLDHLKLSIDAMTVVPGDVNATLAAMRYRLTPRLESAGLHVDWDVDDLPIWERGRRDGQMRHLQFLLFELVSNVLQHAQATRLDVRARAADDGIELTVGDDGRGLADGAVLRSCEDRARAIAAVFEVRRRSPGTEIRIGLPTAL